MVGLLLLELPGISRVATFFLGKLDGRWTANKEAEKLRSDLRKEMRRMYPHLLTHYYYRRDSDYDFEKFWTKEFERAAEKIDLLTEDEQDYLKALFRNLRNAQEEVDSRKPSLSRGDMQCLQVNQRKLHLKLLNALNVVEGELDKEETGPDDYDTPNNRFGDARFRV